MKFLHLGDLHLGKTLNGYGLLEDQRRTLESLLEDLEGRDVDAIVIAGDVYDGTQPSAAATAVFSRFLYQAVFCGYEVFVIPGNHDSAVRLNYAAELLEEEGVHIAEPYRGELLNYELEDAHGIVRVWLMPFLRPADVRAALGWEPEGPGDFTGAIAAALGEVALDPTERNVLVAHQFVTAGGEGPERSDSETIVGTLGNVDGAVFDDFDYVALGHLHRPQRMGRPEVRYAGSLLKYSRSEVGDRKSGVLVELGPKGEVSIELLPLRPPRDMRVLEGPLAELLAEDFEGRGDVDDYLHVTLTDEQVPPDAMARLRRVYPNVMSLEVRNSSTEHAAELEAIPVVDEGFDPVGLFASFYEEQNGIPLTEGQRELVAEAMALAKGAEPDEEDR